MENIEHIMQPEEFKIDPLNKLKFYHFTFNAEVTEDIYLSEYKGSTFRGGFGASFKKIDCSKKANEDICKICNVNDRCSYYKIFQTKIDDELARKLNITKTAPHPFVIQQPLTTQRILKKGETFGFNLLLVGSAIDYLPYFINVFERLGEELGMGKRVNGKKGRYVIKNVTSSGREIYSSQNKTFSSLFEEKIIDSKGTGEVKKIKINFVTPTRLELNKKPVMLNYDLGFTTFMIRLYSRLFLLQAIYCNNGSEIEKYSHHDLETLARKIKLTHSNLHWNDLKRPLNSLNSSKPLSELEWMKYGGFVGEVTFEGELSPFVNMIRLGEYLHVGKYYTFGLGRYEILEIK